MKNVVSTYCTENNTIKSGFKKFLSVLLVVAGFTCLYRPGFAQQVAAVQTNQANADYLGGIDQFYAYILSKMKLDRTCIPGKKIYVRFVIEKDGTLKHARVRGRELSEAMNAQLVKIFEETPKWTPAQQNGRVLRAHFVCPVIFMPRADMMAQVDLPQIDN